MSMMMIAGRCWWSFLVGQSVPKQRFKEVPSEDDENGLEMVIKVEGPVL